MRLTFAFGLLVSFTVLASAARPAPAQDTEDLFERVKRIAAEAKESSRKARDKERERRERTGERGAWGASDDGALLAAGTPTGDVELWNRGGTLIRIELIRKPKPVEPAKPPAAPK